MRAGLAMVLATGLDGAQEAVLRQHNPVRYHFTLRDCRAETPGRGYQHLPFGGLTQAATRSVRRYQRLNENAHRGVGRRKAVIVHVTARLRGPQRRPARPHRREKLGFIGKTEKALELAREIGAGAILDQRRGAHDPKRGGLALPAPGSQQRIENLGCDVALVERKPNLDRNPARRRYVGFVVPAEQAVDPKMPKLMTIRIGSQGEAARRRQAGMRQGCEVGRLRAYPFGIGSEGIVKAEDEG